jgi:membrane protease YdiL (CAAX protease family)
LEEQLRVLVVVAFTLLLVMLRLEAQKFGAAEFDEPGSDGRPPVLAWRAAWYLLGLALIVSVDFIHPNPDKGLLLGLGDPLEAIIFGAAYGTVGALQAVAFAWLRYRTLQLPESDRYPLAVVSSVGTAFFDEAVFRGCLFALLLGTGMDGGTANLIQALVYALSTRLGARGRDPYLLVLTLFIGLFSGWLTLLTGGIGAAFLGHAITRFAAFLTTGHSAPVAPSSYEAEELARRRRPRAVRRSGGASAQ